jgi:hypothetical protein
MAALQQCGQRAARRRRLRGVQALRECTTTHPRRFWAAAWPHARPPLRRHTAPVPAAQHAGAAPVLHPAAQVQRSAAGARRTGPHAAPSRHEAAQTPRPSCRREGLSSAARGMRGRRACLFSRRRGVCGKSASAERAGGEWSALLPCEAHRQAALAIAAHRRGGDRVPLRARWARPQATGTPSRDTAGWPPSHGRARCVLPFSYSRLCQGQPGRKGLSRSCGRCFRARQWPEAPPPGRAGEGRLAAPPFAGGARRGDGHGPRLPGPDSQRDPRARGAA